MQSISGEKIKSDKVVGAAAAEDVTANEDERGSEQPVGSFEGLPDGSVSWYNVKMWQLRVKRQQLDAWAKRKK